MSRKFGVALPTLKHFLYMRGLGYLNHRTPQKSKLAGREEEIRQMLAAHMSKSAIAKKLDVSNVTVGIFIRNHDLRV